MVQSVFQLSGTCNNYPWGKTGRDSLAARYCENTKGTGFKIEDGKDYSEMWYGDYPDFPARELASGQELAKVLEKNKEQLLGKKVVKELDGQLPFLPKVLSIKKALPLQIHPNKELATKLHQKDPEKFSDENHKPEIAVALGPFELFAGWKPSKDLESLFKLDFLSKFNSKSGSFTNDTIKDITKNLLEADDKVIADTQEALSKTKDLPANQKYIQELLPRLQKQYPKQDPGTLVALLCMNFFKLDKGDSVYIPADEIHAYLSGDIIECMARSNNVLNTGFCPRAERDSIELFTGTLTFKQHSKDDVTLPAKKSEKGKSGHTVVYAPPMSEFNMLCTSLGKGQNETITASEGPSCAIVTKGSGKLKSKNDGDFDLKDGYIFFIAPGEEVEWQADSQLEVFAAYV